MAIKPYASRRRFSLVGPLVVGAALMANHALAQASLFSPAGPTRFRDSMGRAELTGRVCEDADGDGRCTGADAPLAGVEVLTDSGAFAVTDARGAYVFRALSPGETVLKVASDALPGGRWRGAQRQRMHLPRRGLTVFDFALRRDETTAADATALTFIASAEVGAGRGAAELPGSVNVQGLLSGQANAGLLSHAGTLRLNAAAGARTVGPSMEVPFTASSERALGSASVGLHLQGLLYEDLGDPAVNAVARRGLVLKPSLAGAARLGSVEAFAEAALWVERSEARSLAVRDGRKLDRLTAALGAAYAVGDHFALAAQATFDHGLAPRAEATDRLLLELEARLRVPALPESGLLIRYAPETGRGPRVQHTLAAEAHFDVLVAHPRRLRFSPAVAMTLPGDSGAAQYYALARLSVRPWEPLLLEVDYRLQHAWPGSAAGAAWVHYASVEIGYDVTAYARVGVYGALKKVVAQNPTSADERQFLARLLFAY